MPKVVTQLLWTTEAVGRRRSTAEGSNPNPPTTATLPCVLNKPTDGSTLEGGALGHRQALVASLVGRRAFRTHRPLRWSPAAGLRCMHRVAVSIAAARVGAARPVENLKAASCEPRYAAPTRLRACLPSQPRRACVTAVFTDACSDTFRPMFDIYLKSTVGSIRVPIVSCTHGCAHAHTHAHHAPHCIQGCRSAGGRGRGAERSRRRRGSAACGGAFES